MRLNADFSTNNGAACLPRELDKNPPRVKTNPKEIPQAASSDADATLELTTSRMAVLQQPDPVIKTEELTANDILEVHNAVRAMQAAEIAAASPDRTSEIDALDILEAESITTEAVVEEAPRNVLPRTLPPPRRVYESTRIIHRDLIVRVQRALTEKRRRSILMWAAALGAWAYFVSFAIVGVYGATKIAKHFSSHDGSNAVASIAPATTPAADETASTQNSDDLAPLLEVEANQLARVSSGSENASTDTTPRASVTSRDEIFRRPSKTQVGVLRVSSSVKGLLVDGTPERVTGGSLILACGDHRIRSPHSSARVVRVPCGKTVTL